MELSNSIKQPNQSFASVLLAFSLFGFFWPDHVNPPNRCHDVNLVKPSEVQQNDFRRFLVYSGAEPWGPRRFRFVIQVTRAWLAEAHRVWRRSLHWTAGRGWRSVARRRPRRLQRLRSRSRQQRDYRSEQRRSRPLYNRPAQTGRSIWPNSRLTGWG